MDDKQCFLLSNTIRDEAFVKSTKEIYLDTADIKYFYYVINEFAKTRKPIESSLKQKQQWKKKNKRKHEIKVRAVLESNTNASIRVDDIRVCF